MPIQDEAVAGSFWKQQEDVASLKLAAESGIHSCWDDDCGDDVGMPLPPFATMAASASARSSSMSHKGLPVDLKVAAASMSSDNIMVNNAGIRRSRDKFLQHDDDGIVECAAAAADHEQQLWCLMGRPLLQGTRSPKQLSSKADYLFVEDETIRGALSTKHDDVDEDETYGILGVKHDDVDEDETYSILGVKHDNEDPNAAATTYEAAAGCSPPAVWEEGAFFSANQFLEEEYHKVPAAIVDAKDKQEAEVDLCLLEPAVVTMTGPAAAEAAATESLLEQHWAGKSLCLLAAGSHDTSIHHD
jgi:hypothetical protein